jgi:mRNA-degrading endonuclease RelE of RelBE toxin-antitoxin system
MTIRFLQPFQRQYEKLPSGIRKKVDRQIERLALDLRHPGTHAKKMNSVGDIWEARVDYYYRMTFQIVDDFIVFRKVGSHAILKSP